MMLTRRTARSQVSVLPWLLGLPLLVLVGIAVALAPPYATALVLGLGLLGVALLMPFNALLLACLVTAAVIGGSAEYFLGMGQANWLPFMLAMLLALKGFMLTQLQPGAGRPLAGQRLDRIGWAWFGLPAVVYVFTLIASSVSNAIPLSQAMAAMKNYLLMWGVLVAVIYHHDMARASTLIWRAFVVIGLLQLPVALYQRFFVASGLANTSASLSFDAINGTFGGGLLGGRSGALAMFICIVLGYLLILWRDRRLGGLSFAGLAMLLLPTLFLIEVKAVVVWLPLVAVLVFSQQLRRRPLLFVFGVLGSLALVVGVIAVYRMSFYSHSSGMSLLEFFTSQIQYVYDPNRFNPETRELGRASVLAHWWREAGSHGGVVNWLFGFGPGASRGVSTVAVGTIAKLYPFYIDLSAAAALLWDVGVVGFVAFCSMLLLGAIECWRMSKRVALPLALRQQYEASGIALLLILSSVIYVRDVIDGTIVQFLIFFMLGTLVFGRRLLSMTKASSVAVSQRLQRG
ncbi:hypothetical protein [Roseateles sp. LYH14W]|uniref:O-antigen ligase domain-containing protein n=1 Tax=Pelomonas parva TaxID=3299032 RepID=A0ABW7F6A2_9BURK